VLLKNFPEDHNNLGIALAEKAIAEHREAIRIKKAPPRAYIVHCRLGIGLCINGHLDEAIAEYREAIRIEKDFPEAHLQLGSALYSKGRVDEAIAEYREAIRLKKDNAGAHDMLGSILRDAKCDYDGAIAEFRESIRLKKDIPGAHNNLGIALYRKGRLDEAIAEHREALRILKNYPDAHCNLGIALMAKGLLDEAIAEYREALRLKPAFAGGHNGLGNALMDKGWLDEAIAEFREAIRLNKDFPEAHYNLGNALKRKGRLDEAIGEYREAIGFKKDFAEAYCNLGSTCELKGQFAEALVYRRRGHELGSKNPRWPYPSAQWVRDGERLVELDGKLPAILSGQKQPADAAERLALAQLCQLPCKKQYAAAVRFYHEAFAAEPKLTGGQTSVHRYNAACAAALAGCGQGADADKLDSQERDRLRRQGLDWLQADLNAYRPMLEKSQGQAGPAIAKQMQHWLQDDDFAGVRSTEALAGLPKAERQEWEKLWQEVNALRQRAAERPSAASSARP
jgi:tetratricopeptide (TPR) repeat protein